MISMRQLVLGIVAVGAIAVLAILVYVNKDKLASKADGGAEGVTTTVAYEESVVTVNTPAKNPITGKGQVVRYYEKRTPYFCPSVKDKPSFERGIDNIQYSGPSLLNAIGTVEIRAGNPVNGESGDPKKIVLGYNQVLGSGDILRKREAYIEIAGRTATWNLVDVDYEGGAGGPYTDSRGFSGVKYGPWKETKVPPCGKCKVSFSPSTLFVKSAYAATPCFEVEEDLDI